MYIYIYIYACLWLYVYTGTSWECEAMKFGISSQQWQQWSEFWNSRWLRTQSFQVGIEKHFNYIFLANHQTLLKRHEFSKLWPLLLETLGEWVKDRFGEGRSRKGMSRVETRSTTRKGKHWSTMIRCASLRAWRSVRPFNWDRVQRTAATYLEPGEEAWARLGVRFRIWCNLTWED